MSSINLPHISLTRWLKVSSIDPGNNPTHGNSFGPTHRWKHLGHMWLVNLHVHNEHGPQCLHGPSVGVHKVCIICVLFRWQWFPQWCWQWWCSMCSLCHQRLGKIYWRAKIIGYRPLQASRGGLVFACPFTTTRQSVYFYMVKNGDGFSPSPVHDIALYCVNVPYIGIVVGQECDQYKSLKHAPRISSSSHQSYVLWVSMVVYKNRTNECAIQTWRPSMRICNQYLLTNHCCSM